MSADILPLDRPPCRDGSAMVGDRDPDEIWRNGERAPVLQECATVLQPLVSVSVLVDDTHGEE